MFPLSRVDAPSLTEERKERQETESEVTDVGAGRC